MPTEPILPDRILVSPEALFQTMGDNAVWLEIQGGNYFSADEIGLRLWQLFTEHEEVDAVVRQMLAEYDVDESTLRQDMAVFIDKLVEAKLVRVV